MVSTECDFCVLEYADAMEGAMFALPEKYVFAKPQSVIAFVNGVPM